MASLTSKVLRITTQSSTHLVVRDAHGHNICELQIPGVAVTVAVPADAEIRIEPFKETLI